MTISSPSGWAMWRRLSPRPHGKLPSVGKSYEDYQVETRPFPDMDTPSHVPYYQYLPISGAHPHTNRYFPHGQPCRLRGVCCFTAIDGHGITRTTGLTTTRMYLRLVHGCHIQQRPGGMATAFCPPVLCWISPLVPAAVVQWTAMVVLVLQDNGVARDHTPLSA